MKLSAFNECRQTITDEDIVGAMKKVPGYLDITPTDFMEIYRVAYHHALDRLKHAITADQIMTRQVISVSETASLAEVVRLLADHDISGMPVIRPDRTLAGVISEKDFLSKMGGGKSPSFMHVILQCLEKTGCMAADIKKLTAADIMSSPAVTLKASTPLFEIADTMDQRNINRIPVVDDNGRLAGIVARTDLVFIIGSFGASAVLIYGAVRSPLAQPRNLVGGHLISAVIGVAVFKLFGFSPWLASSLAVATAIAAMHATKTLHPPGGATALIAVTGTDKIHSLGFLYVFFPVLTGVVIMLIVALVVNNIAGSRKYPEFWW